MSHEEHWGGNIRHKWVLVHIRAEFLHCYQPAISWALNLFLKISNKFEVCVREVTVFVLAKGTRDSSQPVIVGLRHFRHANASLPKVLHSWKLLRGPVPALPRWVPLWPPSGLRFLSRQILLHISEIILCVGNELLPSLPKQSEPRIHSKQGFILHMPKAALCWYFSQSEGSLNSVHVFQPVQVVLSPRRINLCVGRRRRFELSEHGHTAVLYLQCRNEPMLEHFHREGGFGPQWNDTKAICQMKLHSIRLRLSPSGECSLQWASKRHELKAWVRTSQPKAYMQGWAGRKKQSAFKSQILQLGSRTWSQSLQDEPSCLQAFSVLWYNQVRTE